MQLTCFLAFATDETMPTWERKQHVTMEQVAREGFYPSGVFPRVLGKAVSWMQVTTQCAVEDMELRAERAVLSYGSHSFALQNLPTKGCIRVEIMVQSSQLVLETLLAQTRKVLGECVKNLRCNVLVPADGGTRQGGYEEYDGSLVVLYGAKGLQEVEGRGDAMFIGVGQRVEATELRYRFQLFLPPRGLRDSYDVFLSYRWGSLDAELTEALFTLLSQQVVGGKAVQVFLDKQRLQSGRDFQRDFSVALVNSVLFVPVISHHALKRLLTFESDSDVDNLLLEWTLAVDLLEQGKLAGCCPIMMGTPLSELGAEALKKEAEKHKGALVTSLFSAGGPAELPVVTAVNVILRAEKVLSSLSLSPSAQMKALSVRALVHALTSHLGVPAWQPSSASSSAKVGGSSPQHAEAAFKSALLRRAVTLPLLGSMA